MTTTIAPGTRVRFTASSLGVVDGLDRAKFVGSIDAGHMGTYVGAHPSPRLKGWHVVEVDLDGRTLLCPCLDLHFEAAY